MGAIPWRFKSSHPHYPLLITACKAKLAGGFNFSVATFRLRFLGFPRPSQCPPRQAFSIKNSFAKAIPSLFSHPQATACRGSGSGLSTAKLAIDHWRPACAARPVASDAASIRIETGNQDEINLIQRVFSKNKMIDIFF
jgi:hypothetical protein